MTIRRITTGSTWEPKIGYARAVVADGWIFVSGTTGTDHATGTMIEKEDGGGSFKEVVLNPICQVAEEGMVAKAIALHHTAHELCYIAHSVNFEVRCVPTCTVG